MSEEKSSSSVVGIRICLTKFVVDTVVACPVVNASLVSDGVAKHQEKANGEACFV